MAEERDLKGMPLGHISLFLMLASVFPEIIRAGKLKQEPKYFGVGKCIRQSSFGCGFGRRFRLPPHCGRLAHHITHQPLNLSNLILSLTHASVSGSF